MTEMEYQKRLIDKSISSYKNNQLKSFIGKKETYYTTP